MLTALFGPEGAGIAIHPANAPCILAVGAAAAAVAAGGVPAARFAEVPTSGSLKKDEPPPTMTCPIRCCFASATVPYSQHNGEEGGAGDKTIK